MGACEYAKFTLKLVPRIFEEGHICISHICLRLFSLFHVIVDMRSLRIGKIIHGYIIRDKGKGKEVGRREGVIKLSSSLVRQFLCVYMINLNEMKLLRFYCKYERLKTYTKIEICAKVCL